ncbi:type IV pilin N-terminal domain-containing protein [Methanonatronarchaeum sp. AMET-Sl]|uniref:type IV pilin N-terminal domain-containing protein n=1 Tax=Methanonatronarchaeum sp. AMET-Sl TaxID=3037654 RepID=UPI00244E4181|nr:type IV pilin N-terminal domain-containing protein [Methanonatronarchaeum sp. AMET-Sl]WGI17678.1 type IV pilin N-terminal domain-containing protein [Methanonatronarchaeum sp. AMET-Sl]
MKQTLKQKIKKEDGVSPVIGVILMVAIVVLLAAIVAAFVFGVVTIPEPTPQAATTIDDATWDGDTLELTLLHQSGASLAADDTKVIVTAWNDEEDSPFTAERLLSDLEDEFNAGDSWSTGERITLSIEDDDWDLDDDGPNQVEVRLIDVPSEGTISVMTTTNIIDTTED